MFDLLLKPAVLAPVALLAAHFMYMVKQLIWPSNLPNLPVVGSKPGGWFPLLHARWQNSTNYRAVAEEMDALYKNKPCVVPIGGSETVVLLPASEAQHIADQPDAVLNMPQPMIRGLQFKYTVHDSIVIDQPIHQKIVSSNLTHQISNLLGDVLDETEWAFEKYWGTDTKEFKEIAVYDTTRRIIGSATNRAFVGLPACRNPALVDAGMGYAVALPQEARFIRRYPEFLKPFVASFYTKGTKKHTEDFFNILKPEILRRLQDYDVRQINPEDKSLAPEKNDFLQWSIAQARNHPDPIMAEPATLAGRILMINFGAIHTTSFTITHAIFDLFSSNQEYVDELREEIASVLAEHGGEWSKKALSRMERLDSLVRESLRLNMASTFGVPRLVVGKDGFTALSGVHIPRGNTVAVPGKNIARDDAFYPDAQTYKPFRFSERRGGENIEFIKRAQEAAPTTSPEYLPFGHGRHACPGRFFAASELKLTIAYLVMKYDVEMLAERPADIYAGIAKLPPLASKIRVRRRGAAGL